MTRRGILRSTRRALHGFLNLRKAHHAHTVSLTNPGMEASSNCFYSYQGTTLVACTTSGPWLHESASHASAKCLILEHLPGRGNMPSKHVYIYNLILYGTSTIFSTDTGHKARRMPGVKSHFASYYLQVRQDRCGRHGSSELDPCVAEMNAARLHVKAV